MNCIQRAKKSCLTFLISHFSFLILSFSFFILPFTLFLFSCDYGQLGGADRTGAYYPGDGIFNERLGFLSGVWYSHYSGIGQTDGYRIRKWSDLTAADRAKIRALFPDLDVDNPKTYSTHDSPRDSDYILLYDGSVYGQQDNGSPPSVENESLGFGYMGIVRAINIFNEDINRGAIIIEYFEGIEPQWLYETQGLARGEKPFFGIYYRVLQPNIVQMANAVDLAAMYNGDHYYTEKKTLKEAIDFNNVENEAELISWGSTIPQDREPE